MISLLVKYLYREFLLLKKQPRLFVNSWLFFVMIVCFFPLAFSSTMESLQQLAPGLLWIAMVLALLFTAERFFTPDYEEGVIEQWLLSGTPLSIIIAARLIMHWFIFIIPIILIFPLLSLFFHFNPPQILLMISSIVLGTPAVFAVAVLAAAYSVNMVQKGMFMALILLPLIIPVLVFGSGIVMHPGTEVPVLAGLAILAAISIFCITFLPLAIAAVIRIGQS